jgi:oxygen-independent coproporphyrinogen-3 oxidase
MEALYRQLSFELERFAAKKESIETVFIGGGTPSTVAPELYAPLFDLITPYLRPDAEITTEANPNSATRAWLLGMRSLGVNRISFGVQSFDSDKLKALNRAHTPSQAKKAIQTAHELGFAHLSLDLIYNYRGDTKALLQKDIEQAFALPIDHISAYELTIEAGTAFSQTPEVRQENEALAFFVADEIEKRGFPQYEISNFGTYQSLHNRGYWELRDYIGAGAGAVGFLTDRRYYPQTDIERYIADPLQITEEKLSPTELHTEKLFLGLRSNIGIEKSLLSTEASERAALLVKEGKLQTDTKRLYNHNYFLADEIALYLLPE